MENIYSENVEQVGTIEKDEKVKDTQYYAKKMQKKADKYKVEIDECNDIEYLKAEEQKHLKSLEKYDKKIKTKNYAVNASVLFDGKEYDKKYVFEAINRLLDKVELEWSYTLGFYQIHNLLASNPNELSYAAFDSILRILGTQVKYKGFNEWRDILVINEYFKHCNDEYTNDITDLYYLSTLHDTVVQRMQLVEKPSDNINLTADKAE